jgi:hypothetical protein
VIARLCVLAPMLLLCNGCFTYYGGSIDVTRPLNADLTSYQSMAVVFDQANPEFQEGTDEFKPQALNAIRAANLVPDVTEVASLDPEPETDLVLSVTVQDFVGVSSGERAFAGGMAGQAKLIAVVALLDVKTQETLTSGAVAGWTVHHSAGGETTVHAVRRAVENLGRFLRKDYVVPPLP